MSDDRSPHDLLIEMLEIVDECQSLVITCLKKDGTVWAWHTTMRSHEAIGLLRTSLIAVEESLRNEDEDSD